MTESLTSRVSKATQQIEDAGKVYSEVKCADSNTMVDTGCGQVPSLRKVLKDLGGYQYKGVWGSGVSYEAKDQVKDSDGAIWLCIENHTSGAEFDVDAQAGKWIAFQVIRDTPVFNRRVVDFGVGVAFGPYEEDGRTLLPRLRIGAVEYVAVSDVSENLTFTSGDVDDRFDGTVVIQSSGGGLVFSKLDAESMTRQEAPGVKYLSSIEAAATRNDLNNYQRLMIIDRDNAPFEPISSVEADKKISQVKFKDVAGQWWGLDQSGEVNLKWLGAKGDNFTDNKKIFAAVKNISGNLFLPKGLYLTSGPIDMSRGTLLRGEGSMDTDTARSTVVKLMDNANTVLLTTPRYRGEGATHYISLQDLRFDGNCNNQSVFLEDGLIPFWGLYVGSRITNVAINSSYGPALTFEGGSDVYLDHVWVNAAYVTDPNRAAVEFNRSLIGTSGRAGIIQANNFYVENTYRRLPKDGGDPRNIPSDRGNGLLIANVGNMILCSLHIEGMASCIISTGNQCVEISRLSVTHVGAPDNDPDFKQCTVNCIGGSNVFNIQNLHEENQVSSNYLSVLNNTGATSNTIPNIKSHIYTGPIQLYSDDTKENTRLGRTSVRNNLTIARVGSFDGPVVDFQTSEGSSSRHIIQSKGTWLTFNSSVNQPEGVKAFMRMSSYGNSADAMEFYVTPAPVGDDVVNLGKHNARWKNVYSSNGTIQTSDERVKTDLIPISEKELLVAKELKGLIRKYKFNSAVLEKGDSARIHFGIGAQTVQKTFAKHGLDGFSYGLLCYDECPETKDDNGNVIQEAYSRYGVRYDELCMFILSAI